MTIQQAIQSCDSLKPNQYTEDDKIRWLSNLDGLIFCEIIGSYEEEEEKTFSGYTNTTPKDTELLVQDPYSDVYIKYLFAQIDFNNAEYTRYNNSMMMYNMAYIAFADYYNREHKPKKQQITL